MICFKLQRKNTKALIKMFTKNIKLFTLFSIISLSGCMPSQEMVNSAQATANRALIEAETANTRAENAKTAAEAAQKAAKDANDDFNGIMERMERMFQKAQEK